MDLTPAQAVIGDDTSRFRVISCGRRFGKTTLAIEEIKGMALNRASNIVYIAPTIQQARDIAWQILKKELDPIILRSKESPTLELTVRTLQKPTRLNPKPSSNIKLRGWEAIETLRGQAFDLLVIDEVAMMRNFWVNFEEVIRPTLTDRKGQVMFISTPKGFNHFYDLYNMENDPKRGKGFKSFHFTSYDNPFLPKEELDEAKNEIGEDRFAQEYLADFRKTQGLVYKEFDRKLHLYDNIKEEHTYIEKVVAVDFGYTNPTGQLLIYKDRDNNLWVDDEWKKTKQTNDQIFEKTLNWKPNKVYGDPEAPEKIEEGRRLGLNMMEVVKGRDSVMNGINKVRELLKQNRLHINKRCLDLIGEFESYSYPDNPGDKNAHENPVKDNDHLLDALRYYVLMTVAGSIVPNNFKDIKKTYK